MLLPLRNILVNNIFVKIKRLNTNVKVRLLLSFVTRLHTTSLVILLPIFFSELTSTLNTTLLLFCILGSNLLGKILAGSLGDRYNKKKILVMFNWIEVIIYLLLSIMLYLIIHNFFLLGLLFSLNSLFSSSKGPILESLLFESVSEEELKFVYAVNYWLSNLSMSFSFIISGFLLNGNLLYIIIFGFLCHILTVNVIKRFLLDNYRDGNEVEKFNQIDRSKTGYTIVFSDKRFLLFSFGFLLILSVEMQLTNYIAVYFNQNYNHNFFSYNINGVKLVSILQIINTLVIVIVPIFLPNLISIGGEKALLIAVTMYSLGFSLLLLIEDIWILMLLALIYSLGELIYYPNRQAILANLVPKENPTKYFAFNQIIVQSSKFIGAIGIYVFGFMRVDLVSITISLMGITGGLIIYKVGNKVR
ncbi:MFS transporter [Cytobacillus firmus]|uniref:MFS transporter n=1 Tax=Cytobacillus firmus TaxID=1399 RepID=UPI0018CC97EB|nr:MFS transporter [Cytobacillus firmus]MBG9590197.1 hypothetical protein [Cytobacillus firmus]